MTMKALLHVAVASVMLLVSARCGVCDAPTRPQPELKTARAVPVKYYLSLPAGWTAAATWPIVVCIDGSGHNFLTNCQSFIQARKDRPFIIVTPNVTSNGNDPADLAAVLDIVREVQKDYSGQSRFFITGFSAGGHLAWQVVFDHPDLIDGAALAAGNFRFRGIATISKSPKRVHLPIRRIQGDKDPHVAALTQQWNDAEKLARDNGYENLAQKTVPGAGHQAFPKEVLDFFTSLLPK
jgi:poly(3-hydroxybutyrate) depolymerase